MAVSPDPATPRATQPKAGEPVAQARGHQPAHDETDAERGLESSEDARRPLEHVTNVERLGEEGGAVEEVHREGAGHDAAQHPGAGDEAPPLEGIAEPGGLDVGAGLRPSHRSESDDRQHGQAERVGGGVEHERAAEPEGRDADARCDRSEHDRHLVRERHEGVRARQVRLVDEARRHRLERRVREGRSDTVERAESGQAAEVVRAEQRQRGRYADHLRDRQRRLGTDAIDHGPRERAEQHARHRECDAEERPPPRRWRRTRRRRTPRSRPPSPTTRWRSRPPRRGTRRRAATRGNRSRLEDGGLEVGEHPPDLAEEVLAVGAVEGEHVLAVPAGTSLDRILALEGNR